MSKCRIIQYGLGVMGSQMVSLVLEKAALELVGAIEASGRMAGKDLGQAIGLERDLGIIVSDKPDEVFQTTEADVVLHSTVSSVAETARQIRRALETGKNVITIAEEVSFPYLKSPELASQLDKLAQKNGVSLLGTGVNPGFMMDYLPIILTSMMKHVNKIEIRRVIPGHVAGISVWQHFGLGKSIGAFNEGLTNKEVVLHVGQRESMMLVARALGWELENFKETRQPRISKSKRVTPLGTVEPGAVCGFDQIVRGFMQGEEVLTYQQTVIAAPDPEEDGIDIGTDIVIHGVPSAKIAIRGELAEQAGWATVARTVNSIPQVVAARPGLISVDELSPSPCLPQVH